jgi:hypothetical protein
MERSGAVAMGLSAINLYLGVSKGNNTVEDYVSYVKNDLMGIARKDLVANIARHVDSSVHLFENGALPIWKDEEGNYVNEGRWQIMIHGESYKNIVSEAAKNALRELGEQWQLLRAGFYHGTCDVRGPLCGGSGLQCAGKTILRIQGQGSPGCHGRGSAYFPSANRWVRDWADPGILLSTAGPVPISP